MSEAAAENEGRFKRNPWRKMEDMSFEMSQAQSGGMS